MKKIIITLLVALSLLNAETFNLSDKEIVDKVSYKIIEDVSKHSEIDTLSGWYLKHTAPNLYSKVYHDEFRLMDEKEKAHKQLIEYIKIYKNFYKDKIFISYLRSKVKKYDFKNSRFPIEALVENSTVNYSGNLINYITMSFINTKKMYLNMEKDKARIFMKKLNYNREIIVKYTLKIVELNKKRNSVISEDYGHLDGNAKAKILGAEIIDFKTNEVLKSINFIKKN